MNTNSKCNNNKCKVKVISNGNRSMNNRRWIMIDNYNRKSNNWIDRSRNRKRMNVVYRVEYNLKSGNRNRRMTYYRNRYKHINSRWDSWISNWSTWNHRRNRCSNHIYYILIKWLMRLRNINNWRRVGYRVNWRKNTLKRNS